MQLLNPKRRCGIINVGESINGEDERSNFDITYTNRDPIPFHA